ncbi:MAG: hypothetical protein ACOYI9_08755 [Candidatus Hydrogenedentales bacterium]|jgi:antitoxin (DNA-binding transcriptional repressor) of toxin-antitoxin stability system
MIYDFPDTSAHIRQGDIFIDLPRVEMSLKTVTIFNDVDQRVTNWMEIAEKGDEVSIIVPVRPVAAIVATQDCDAVRSPDITLLEIRNFRDVERKSQNTTSAKSWKNLITQHARLNQKWFYLPPDDRIGFGDKMAVDFMVTLRVRRRELEELRCLRKGRLNKVADEHFRERIGEFFRRYPYDEWYPLDQEEWKAYKNEYSDAKPFPWQEVKEVDGGPL